VSAHALRSSRQPIRIAPERFHIFANGVVGQQHDRGFIDLNAGQPPLAIRR